MVRRLAAIPALIVLLLVGCRDRGNDARESKPSDRRVTVVGPGARTDAWVAAAQAPLRGWEPIVVAGSAWPTTSVFFIGGVRSDRAFGRPAVRRDSFRFDPLPGRWTRIASPPMRRRLGAGVAVATSDDVYLIAQDCDAVVGEGTGDAGCARGGRTEVVGLRYEIDADRWARWPHRARIRELFPHGLVPLPRPVPGLIAPRGTLYFEFADRVIVYDLASRRWTTVLQSPGGLPPACTDGRRLYTVDPASIPVPLGPAERASRVTVDLVTSQPGREAATEPVTVSYPSSRPFRLPPIGLWCTSSRVVLGPAAFEGAARLPLTVRDGRGRYGELAGLPANVTGDATWSTVSSREAIYAVARSASRLPDRTGTGWHVLRLDPAARSIHVLPPHPDAMLPVGIVAAGDAALVTYPLSRVGGNDLVRSLRVAP